MAGYCLTYPQARSWLVNAGIDPSPYDNSEYNMLDCLVDLIQEKRWYPDKISVNPIDDLITCEPVFVLTRITVLAVLAVHMLESDEDLELKSSRRAVVSRTTRCPGVHIIKLSYNALIIVVDTHKVSCMSFSLFFSFANKIFRY